MPSAPDFISSTFNMPEFQLKNPPSSQTFKDKIMIVTGEASGDEHAAKLVKEISLRRPGVSFFGMGGSKLRAAGVNTVVDSEEVGGVMGLFELWGKLGGLLKAQRTLVAECEKQKPSLLILMDFPDFNFILGKRLRKIVPKTLYFVAPQVWAWRAGRVQTMKRFVDKVAAIFPFEAEFYQRRGMDAEYVGHPFLLYDRDKKQPSLFDSSIGLDAKKPTIALLPGSRALEIDRLLDVMLESFSQIKKVRPGVQGVLPLAPALNRKTASTVCEKAAKVNVKVVKDKTKEVLRCADVAIISSGTATMEACAMGVPFVSIYKVLPVTYFLGRIFVRGVSFFTMPNIISSKKVVPELLQNEVTKESVCETVEKLLGDPGYREKILSGLCDVMKTLEVKDKKSICCFENTADIALKLMSIEAVEEKRRVA